MDTLDNTENVVSDVEDNLASILSKMRECTFATKYPTEYQQMVKAWAIELEGYFGNLFHEIDCLKSETGDLNDLLTDLEDRIFEAEGLLVEKDLSLHENSHTLYDLTERILDLESALDEATREGE